MADDSETAVGGEHVDAADAFARSTKKQKLTNEEKIARERDSLIAAMANGASDRLSDRVASILSRYPEARDNDVTLQLEYWRIFEPELFGLLRQDIEHLRDLTPSGSLIRARQKIQNSFGMFIASAPVRAARGKLSEEERDRHSEVRVPGPGLSIYADETGKTAGDYLVGSVWVIDSGDVGKVYNRVQEWRHRRNFKSELHFVDIRDHNVQYYREFVDVVIAAAPTISFKSVAVSRVGISHHSKAFDVLFYELLVRGVAHENETGRAPLPRSIFFVKDAENAGSDALLLLQLRNQIEVASNVQFANQLAVNGMSASESHTSDLVQMADLYASSLNRGQARDESAKPKAKDEFAVYLIGKIDTLTHTISGETISGEEGDLHLRLRL